MYVKALEAAAKKGIDTNSYRDIGKNKKSVPKKKSTSASKTKRTKKGSITPAKETSSKKKRKRLNKISNYGTMDKNDE